MDADNHRNIGSLFPPLPRRGQSKRRERKNRNNRKEILTKEKFFGLVKENLINNRFLFL